MGYYAANPIMWALAISMATVAGIWTFFALRRGARRAALRGVAFVLLPFGLLFTGTLTLLVRIADVITQWASRLVFAPMVWLGLLLLAVSAGLFVLGGRKKDTPGRSVAPGQNPSTLGSRPPAVDPVDPEMAEIEALLRKRGIT
ncbi:MAG: hypothetical protein QM714_04925 [Nocardioides sp.]|uniref:hypothetical protein n=1 Tax=Nocardioides sp. TaxID=35761 RepID=UPI0039E54AE9